MVADAKKAAEVLGGRPPKPGSAKGGRPGKSTSTRAVAAAVGVATKTVREAEQHVETAEEFPFMQGWRQSEVLAVREELRLLTTAGRARPENALSARLRLRRPRAIVW